MQVTAANGSDILSHIYILSPTAYMRIFISWMHVKHVMSIAQRGLIVMREQKWCPKAKLKEQKQS